MEEKIFLHKQAVIKIAPVRSCLLCVGQAFKEYAKVMLSASSFYRHSRGKEENKSF
jgi:hypothetical protein